MAFEGDGLEAPGQGGHRCCIRAMLCDWHIIGGCLDAWRSWAAKVLSEGVDVGE